MDQIVQRTLANIKVQREVLVPSDRLRSTHSHAHQHPNQPGTSSNTNNNTRVTKRHNPASWLNVQNNHQVSEGYIIKQHATTKLAHQQNYNASKLV